MTSKCVDEMRARSVMSWDDLLRMQYPTNGRDYPLILYESLTQYFMHVFQSFSPGTLPVISLFSCRPTCMGILSLDLAFIG